MLTCPGDQYSEPEQIIVRTDSDKVNRFLGIADNIIIGVLSLLSTAEMEFGPNPDVELYYAEIQ